jgi:hypothetical protein
MLKADWFNLPMERELTLLKIAKEVDECRDIETLRESIKQLSHQNARYQHMIGEMLKETLTKELASFEDAMSAIDKLEAGDNETN